ncbi:MAG: cyclase family protein [Candidatus Flexifilum sp.]|jgi:arylformamidase
MAVFDITRTIRPTLAVWPGDAIYSLTTALSLAAGDAVNLMTIRMSPHTGAHADAYFHYRQDGVTAAEMPLEAYLGPAQVVTTTRSAGPLFPEDFAGIDFTAAPRLLIHSPVSALADDVWPTAFPYLSVELIAHLAAQGVRLVGLDSPSVDAFDSRDLPCHRALYEHGMVNLECLYLHSVPDGLYELIALPLKLDGACASPVRAVLRSGG